MAPIISYLLSGDTAAYQVKASDVNNTAFVLNDKTKITFYPTGHYDETGFDDNDTYWDEGVWDVNSTVNAIELVSMDTDNQTPTGDIVYFAFQHANPTSGDIITARDIDNFSDERFTAAITSVIPLMGDENNFNNPGSTADDLNSTAIRTLEGYALNLFANGMYTLSIDADTGLSKDMASGFWGVDNGFLGLTDENGSQVIRQMIFDPKKPVDGSLGYVMDSQNGSTFVIRQVVDINATDPGTSPYAITPEDISDQVVILMNGNALQFYDINTSNQGYYRDQGRSDEGIYDENGIYELNTTNGTVTLIAQQDGYVTNFATNSKPDVGTVIMAYEPDIDELTPYVIRRKFDFNSSDIMASLTDSSLEKQMVLFTDGSTFSFYQDGICRMYGWSTADQALYAKHGTWNINNSTGAAELDLYDESGDMVTTTIQCNSETLGEGVKCNVTQDGMTQDKIIKNMIPLYNNIQAIDAYPEYKFKAINTSGTVPTSNITINGVNYTVVPYSEANMSGSQSGSDITYHISFYGQHVDAGIAEGYFDTDGTIVLKVFKGSEFVGSFGPFDNNNPPVLGEHGFGGI